ncbi:MAG: hypothetical protein IKN11_09600 [Bacteroidales bacterium]|nr:hypothetical protein [Bacteroidales bacterium]
MKKHLLLVLLALCVTVGLNATITTGSSTWMQYNANYDQENVLTIYVDDPGELATAIAGLDFTGVDILHISARNREASLLQLSDADITALEGVSVTTIEMMRAYVQPFTFTNSNVKRIILPYNWTKEQVKAVGLANSTNADFECCISMNDQDKYDNRDGDAALIAYLSQANTLKNAIMRTFNDTHGYAPLGNQVYQGGGDCSRLRYLTVMGNFCARDISRCGVYDANGHYVINGVADENNTTWNMNTDGVALYAGANSAGAVDGALASCQNIYVIDLRDGYVPDDYATDIVLGYNGIQATNLREVWMPEDARFNTVPADYCNINSNYLRQICIPGNIKKIKTRAFAGAGTSIDYIWTTGDNPNVRYDNGCYRVLDASGNVTMYNANAADTLFVYHTDAGYVNNDFTYGTITLPPNLELIERYAFSSSVHVKDVYSLNTTAPECHVDAFNSVSYYGNNGITSPTIAISGIITRGEYTKDNYQMLAVLHYPRETATPNTQRYTDPSRVYSVATGDRDGNGNTLYFPSHSEFAVAYWQGTFGYLWDAWDGTRTWYDNTRTLGTGGGWYGFDASTGGHDWTGGQQAANNFYIDNDDTNPDNKGVSKVNCGFYDVTMGDHNQFGELEKPEGLNDYWTLTRSGKQLYPQAEMSTTYTFKYVEATQADVDNGISIYTKSGNTYTEYSGPIVEGTTYYKRIQEQVYEDGEPQFISCANGHYVEDFEYVDDPEGDYVRTVESITYNATTSPVADVTTYYQENSGAYDEATPLVGSGYYYVSGSHPVFSVVDKNNDAIVDGRQYYKLVDGTYTASDLYFYFWGSQQPLYYYDGEISVPDCEQLIGQWQNTADLWNAADAKGLSYDDLYVERNGVKVQGAPNLSGTFYVEDGNGGFKAVTTVQPKGTLYYVLENGNYKLNWNSGIAQFTENVYYATGTSSSQSSYSPSDVYIPGKTWYTYNTGSKQYTQVTSNLWSMISTPDYYYISGNEDDYSSAENQPYDSSEQYYVDESGVKTPAESVTFDGTYYYTTNNYAYAEYTGIEEGDRVSRHYFKRLKEDGETADTYYCPVMEDVKYYDISNFNDYRGWHQFVLAAVAHNSTEEFEPLRSFIIDNDWWTICEPYDLSYNDLIKFFGFDRAGFEKKIPYLSKLMYVVRDVNKRKITLMFSKNLMEYKEYEMVAGEKTSISEGSHVHGMIDDDTKWTAEELAKDPIILHAGVPYLIRPNLWAPSGETITRKFDVYKNDNPELYERLHNSQKLSGDEQKDLIYKGEYTVPSFVVGLEEEGAAFEYIYPDGELEITNLDGSEFLYQDTETSGKTLTYRNNVDVPFKISQSFTYTFVGTFYKCVMPIHCYFLGWDSTKGKAAFWYSRVQDKTGWNWNNETGVICPNFDTNWTIHAATGMKDPARWTLTEDDDTHLLPDDFPSAGGAKSYGMEMGATNFFEFEEDGVATSIEEMPTEAPATISIYTTEGVYVGSKVQGLKKGIYVINGKKYVVK